MKGHKQDFSSHKFPLSTEYFNERKQQAHGKKCNIKKILIPNVSPINSSDFQKNATYFKKSTIYKPDLIPD